MIGQTLSHFEITAKLGEGGMGEVYRATDTNLDREVAIKVLPEEFVADPERLARFEREAKVLASLNHPHIAAIHGMEKAEEQSFLILELVEGETLAERIAKGPVPMQQALELGRQIAEALEAAHEHGIVHRDLKPANVKVTPEGQVKVLDFGLAKPMASETPEANLADSPTLTAEMTRAGLLLGTVAYMSPEQARGAPTDRRADIWAFGVVLLEMITGRSPFAAETVPDALAAVLTCEIDLGDLPPGTPPHARWLLTRCLERDPRLRLRDVGEARISLAAGTSPVAEAERAGRARGPGRGLIVAAVAAAGIVGLLIGRQTAPPEARPSLRKVDIVLPEQLLFFQAPPEISPDGSAILLASERGLYLRRLDRVGNQSIPGTAGAIYSTWAPDSREIAFVTPGRLWRATLDGESPVSIATLPAELGGGGGMVWTADDRILLAGSPKSGLMEVSARGGVVREAVPLDRETERDFHEVSLLPDGRGALVSVHPDGATSNRIDVIAGGERRTVLYVVDGGWVENPVYSPPGFALFSKGSGSSPELWAVPFSLEELETTGEPFLVAPTGAAPSVARDGTVAYVRGRRLPLRQALATDASGRIETELARLLPGGRYPAVSPDETKLAVSIVDQETYDLMVFDIASRTGTRLTSGGGAEVMPAWSPDGTRIAYSMADRDLLALVEVDKPGEPETLAEGQAPQWLPDGQSIVYQRFGGDSSWDIWRYWPDDGREEPLLEGTANDRWPVPSPDGRWLAYGSDETGREEVFVRGFPTGEKIQVSRRGATEPRWVSADELVFRSLFGLYSTRRVRDDWLAFEEPRLVLSLPDGGLLFGEGVYGTRPGGGFVVLRNVITEDAAVLTLVTDWASQFVER